MKKTIIEMCLSIGGWFRLMYYLHELVFQYNFQCAIQQGFSKCSYAHMQYKPRAFVSSMTIIYFSHKYIFGYMCFKWTTVKCVSIHILI